MDILMDWLHVNGVNFIVTIQDYFKDHVDLMLFLSHLGDPRNAFLIYFPLAYFCHQQTGVKVIWAGAISEWLNAIFKWFLFGHRPYWWVHTTDLYEEGKQPHVEQFKLTCETGPGSPSGHAMVTAAVWYLIIKSLITHKNINSNSRCLWMAPLWTAFGLMMASVSLSRCFIAAHFPHQVIFGTVVGILIGELIRRLEIEVTPLRFYIVSTSVMLLSAPATYWTLGELGYDPTWTITYAKQWCARPEWVYLDTTPFFAVTRDASVLLGAGIAVSILQRFKGKFEKVEITDSETSAAQAVVMIVLSIVFTRGLEYVPLPDNNLSLFYTFAFFRYLTLPCVVCAIPQMFGGCVKKRSVPKTKNG